MPNQRPGSGIFVLHNLDRILLGVGVILFGLLFAAHSFPNHYFFRTLNTDLGYFSHAMFDYSQLRWADVGKFKNILRDHVSIYPMILAPLRWIFGSWTLLIVQIVALLAGGLGVARFIQMRSAQPGLPALAAWSFWIFFGLYAALDHDYHNTVVGAALVPWFFVAIGQQKFRQATILFVLLILCKESFALFAGSVCLGLAWEYRKTVATRRRLLIYTGLAFVWFAVCLWGIIPYFSPEGKGFRHFSYSTLGSNFGEAIVYLFQFPGFAIRDLFKNTLEAPSYDSLKVATWFILFLSGGWAVFKKPQYLLMALPILAAKFWSDKPEHWSLSLHYSIELAPILILAAFSVLSEFKKPILALSLGMLTFLLCLGATHWTRTAQHPQFVPKPEKRISQAAHWESHYPVEEFYEHFKKIPADADIGLHNRLFAHLCFRREPWPYPENMQGLEYIILLDDHPCWPVSADKYAHQLEYLRADTAHWESLVDEHHLLLLKRRTDSATPPQFPNW